MCLFQPFEHTKILPNFSFSSIIDGNKGIIGPPVAQSRDEVGDMIEHEDCRLRIILPGGLIAIGSVRSKRGDDGHNSCFLSFPGLLQSCPAMYGIMVWRLANTGVSTDV